MGRRGRDDARCPECVKRGGCPECAKLRRALAKAKREVERLQGVAADPEPRVDPPPPKDAPGRCPKCGSDRLGTYQTPGGKTATGCRACRKYRKIA